MEKSHTAVLHIKKKVDNTDSSNPMATIRLTRKGNETTMTITLTPLIDQQYTETVMNLVDRQIQRLLNYKTTD
jgi:hypothetical protein